MVEKNALEIKDGKIPTMEALVNFANGLTHVPNTGIGDTAKRIANDQKEGRALILEGLEKHGGSYGVVKFCLENQLPVTIEVVRDFGKVTGWLYGLGASVDKTFTALAKTIEAHAQTLQLGAHSSKIHK